MLMEYCTFFQVIYMCVCVYIIVYVCVFSWLFTSIPDRLLYKFISHLHMKLWFVPGYMASKQEPRFLSVKWKNDFIPFLLL